MHDLAIAQTEGRVSVGASVTLVSPTDDDVNTSFAVRSGVGVTLTVAPRVAIVGFGGYLINRPKVTFRVQFGQELRDR